MSDWLDQDLRISAIVLVPIVLGHLLGRLGVPKRAARSFFGFAFFGCQTVITVAAIWIARIHDEARFLPLLALLGWLITAAAATFVSRKLSNDPPRRGAFILSMTLSNNGFTLLGLVAIAVFGDAGLAQATYAQLLYTPFFLLCGFPIARAFARNAERKPLAALLLSNARDARVWVVLLAVGLGLCLNLAHVARPPAVATLTRVLIFLGTAASSCAIGLLFSGLHLRRFWREHLLSLIYRCTLYPALYWAAARAAGLRALDANILVLYGLVPSALLANMLAVFFELDADLTSSMFIVSTLLFLLCVLPLFLIAVAP
jgi:predicted permease